MLQEQKELLLKDLCARLSYGVKGRVSRCDYNNRECEFVATIDGKCFYYTSLDVIISNLNAKINFLKNAVADVCEMKDKYE